MRRAFERVLAAALAAGALLATSAAVRADGYYYQPRSLYVMPPLYAYTSVFGPQPIIVYEPVVTYPAPVAGYYAPLAARAAYPAPAAATVPAPAASIAAPAPARIRERQISTPFRTRYRYKADYPGGLDYKYRYKQDFGRVRFSEKWD